MSHSIESAYKVLSTNFGEPDNTLTLRNLLIKRFQALEQTEDVTIDDVLLTHNLFLTSSFKPFVSTSSIYIKTTLPHFNLGSFVTIDLDRCFNGDFIHDMYLDITVNELGDINNTDITALKYRYTPYPGIRLIEKVELWLNGRKVDSYNQEDMLFYMNNELSDEKREAFKRCVGQSEYKESYYYSNDREQNEIKYITDGYQTFKSHQDKLHMTVPLLFWFNKYIEKSYPVLKQDSVIINNSRNHLKVTFASLDKIIQIGKYNADKGVTDNTTELTPYFDYLPLANITLPRIDIELYVNNIYVNEEVRKFYIANIDMYMVTTYSSFNMNAHNLDEIKIKDLSDMTPYLYFAFRTEANEKSFTNWHKFTWGKRKWYPVPVYESDTVSQNGYSTNVFILTLKRCYYDTEYPIIKKFLLNFDTLPYVIYDSPSDYNKYMAQQKGDQYTYSYDKGIYLLSFCRKFTDVEPSGHINFTKIQEVILKFDVDENIKGQKMKLYISAKRINLLSINDTDVYMQWSSYLA